MKVTLGGERLGSGNKQEISMRNYERSTHDLGYVWRSSMASGTLVPFMSELSLPGDSMDIDLDMHIMTLPTIGPLFGSYKVQADIFLVPMRIYNGKLHMNKLGIGNDMSRAKIPQMEVRAMYIEGSEIKDNMQINSSCILSYLNVRGAGLPDEFDIGEPYSRFFNAIPLLGYWDIYKQYYANKQEERGFVIHSPAGITQIAVNAAKIYTGVTQLYDLYENPTVITLDAEDEPYIVIGFAPTNTEPNPEEVTITLDSVVTNIMTIWESASWNENTYEMTYTFFNGITGGTTAEVEAQSVDSINPEIAPINLTEFPLENIDTIKEDILMAVKDETAFIINYNTLPPYGLLFAEENANADEFSKKYSQEGLGIKTYQSDLFNNWISTEWIDGAGGVNEISAVSTAGDSFTIDALNLAQKVYVMLNRIALSGGTYDDWLDAVYTHDRAKSMENPAYMGSLIKELTFDEVISNAATTDSPLGTLAGRGQLTQKHKGGSIKIKTNEPCYIMGIVSITPRIDYSQGNKWDMNLKTWNDLHKPALDAIGFEDLITDQMAWFDTRISPTGTITYKSAGKQPAWINYMTNVNQVRGSFAEKTDSMWMTLNRRYEAGETGFINDLTTYVDPVKFNQIFADTRLDAQNFWVQIKVENIARRKMSAKVIPNL